MSCPRHARDLISSRAGNLTRPLKNSKEDKDDLNKWEHEIYCQYLGNRNSRLKEE